MKLRFTYAVVAIFIVQAAVLAAVGLLSNRPNIVQYTPIPPLPLATLPVDQHPLEQNNFGTGACQVHTLDLIGAWVIAGKPEQEAFPFNDEFGKPCLGSFEPDILPLFTQPNIWYPAAIACSTCHNQVEISAAQLNLSSYEDILSGSRRTSQSDPGQDILGDAETWTESKLYIQVITKQMPISRPADAHAHGPLIFAGIMN